MKPLISAAALLSLGAHPLLAQSSSVYTNFIRQVQFPALENGEFLEKDVSVESAGAQLSPLAVSTGGARFELWALRNAQNGEYLLDSTFVGTYVPTASLKIVTEDPYTDIPRTRADRPFNVVVTVNGLLKGDGYPDAAKSVNFLHHVQSYGDGGTRDNINPDNATLSNTVSIDENVTDQSQAYVVTIPASSLKKARGEERFSLYTLDDYQAPASQLSSQFVQIWPVAEGAISGIIDNQKVLFAMPQITLTFKDLYPDSSNYLQVYKGGYVAGTVGVIVPGSSYEVNNTVPDDFEELTLTASSWTNEILDKDGEWTIELVTKTPFDTVSLAHVTFSLDRTIEVNGNITTSD